MEQKYKIRTFKDLHAWKEAHVLALGVYRLSKSFPKDETYGLTSQMKRAVVSVSSNIAEGFSRRSGKDKSHFYTMAAGSVTELQNQLQLAKDLEYCSEADFHDADYQAGIVLRLLNGLIAKTRDLP